jgi:hypothetical protein
MPRGAYRIGRTRTLGEFGVRLDSAASGLDDAMAEALQDAAGLVADGTLAALRRGSGGDLVLSNVGDAGGRIGVKVETRSREQTLIRAVGPAHLMDRPTAPHWIERRAKGRRALKTPYGYRRKVRHPGTRGKGGWTKTVDALLPQIPKMFGEALHRHLQKTTR